MYRSYARPSGRSDLPRVPCGHDRQVPPALGRQSRSLDMIGMGWAALAVALAIPLYAYGCYPALLKLLGIFRPSPQPPAPPAVWPAMTVKIGRASCREREESS